MVATCVATRVKGANDLTPAMRLVIHRAWGEGWGAQDITKVLGWMTPNNKRPGVWAVYDNLRNKNRVKKKKKTTRGRKRIFSTKMRQELKKLLENEQKKTTCGIEITAAYLKKKLKIKMTDQTLRNELHRLGYRWRRPQKKSI